MCGICKFHTIALLPLISNILVFYRKVENTLSTPFIPSKLHSGSDKAEFIPFFIEKLLSK